MSDARLRQRIEALYGDWDPSAEVSGGVIHVASVWQDAPGHWRVIDIGPHAPPSKYDRFALDLARARADLIVTTGAILRAEPELRYELRSDFAEELEAWRARERSSVPPTVVILTSGQELDFGHPTFHGWAIPVVFTAASQVESLRARAPGGIEIVGMSEPTPRNLLSWARHDRRAETLVLEAGIRTSAQLHEPPVAVDELMLSVFEGASLHPHARGRSFVSPAHIQRSFDEPRPARRIAEPSGPWSFHRYVRR